MEFNILKLKWSSSFENTLYLKQSSSDEFAILLDKLLQRLITSTLRNLFSLVVIFLLHLCKDNSPHFPPPLVQIHTIYSGVCSSQHNSFLTYWPTEVWEFGILDCFSLALFSAQKEVIINIIEVWITIIEVWTELLRSFSIRKKYHLPRPVPPALFSWKKVCGTLYAWILSLWGACWLPCTWNINFWLLKSS